MSSRAEENSDFTVIENTFSVFHLVLLDYEACFRSEFVDHQVNAKIFGRVFVQLRVTLFQNERPFVDFDQFALQVCQLQMVV